MHERLDFAPVEPEWSPCTRCGQETAGRGLCWDCQKMDDSKIRKAENWGRLLASVPHRYREENDWAQFGNPRMTLRVRASEEQMTAASKAARALAPRVVLTGPAGAGKTSLGVAMLREAGTHLRKSFALFLPARALSGGIFALADEWLHAHVVLLDDVGAERQQTNNLVSDLICERHDRNLCTWVTTGLSQAEINSRYGDGVGRRVFERAIRFDLKGAP